MCELCQKARDSGKYGSFIAGMLKEDRARMEYSKEMAKTLGPVARSAYSSMNWPVKLVYPMFEARAAYAVPNNYFQNIVMDGERLGNGFAHGAMRSAFFAGGKLVILSKSVNFHDAKEFFTSYLLLHLERGEYQQAVGAGEIRITADLEKPMMNLVSGKVEKKRIAFTFIHQSVDGRIVSKEQAATSARFKNVYARYGGASMKSASMDMEGYAITVPHFSPHPYLLQLHSEFGYETNKEFQLHAADYFRAHLGQPGVAGV
ncbi:hypothetical protein L0Y65_05295 [Candidatus Micrarchaeota archaeon]|nr:hypothetical protein [Candidatus Micrarchaeota archaeon]